MEPLLLCSLRGHGAPVVCSSFLSIGLFSGDSKGYVYWWDVKLKRPQKKWKAHDETIVLIQLFDNNTVLLTHGRDSSIKFWDLKASNLELSVTELPVNSLNFCNVAINSSRLLLTASTVDSDKFDIYSITSSHPLQFSRICHQVDPWQLYQKALKTLPIPLDDDLSKRDKFGIMMKSIWINDQVFYIAYESGHILGFYIESDDTSQVSHTKKVGVTTTTSSSLINRGPKINLFHISDQLCPSPILSIAYDVKRNVLVAGSSGKLVLTLDVPESFSSLIEDSSKAISIKHAGLSHMVIIGDITIITFWNGITKGFVSASMDEIWKFDKILPTIDKNDETQSNRLKVTSMTFQVATPRESQITRSSKELIRMKRDTLDKNLLAIGYENGIISVYEV